MPQAPVPSRGRAHHTAGTGTSERVCHQLRFTGPAAGTGQWHLNPVSRDLPTHSPLLGQSLALGIAGLRPRWAHGAPDRQPLGSGVRGLPGVNADFFPEWQGPRCLASGTTGCHPLPAVLPRAPGDGEPLSALRSAAGVGLGLSREEDFGNSPKLRREGWGEARSAQASHLLPARSSSRSSVKRCTWLRTLGRPTLLREGNRPLCCLPRPSTDARPQGEAASRLFI